MSRLLIGCEESQEVTKAFRALGHEAYSCDLQDCSGGHPEWHLKMDVFEAIELIKPDMGVFHPPCRFIANSGVRWLFEKDGRWKELDEACNFFKRLLDSPIHKIAIENPVPHKWGLERIGRKWKQKVHPYHFGDNQKKSTCLWPPKDKVESKKWEIIWRMPPGKEQKQTQE